MFYPMIADIYYATMVQQESGAIEKSWDFDRSVPCELKSGSFNTEMRYALQTFDEFFANPTILYGRFKEGIDTDESGYARELTDILVTNIRTNDECSGSQSDPLFVEPHDGEMVPIVYEVRNLSPFINPWGRAEHFKVQLKRSDNQEVTYD